MTHVRTFQGIDEFILDNGLVVLLFQDDSQANVTVNLTYLVGSRHEGRGEAGMAHLLEHMLFRGTTNCRDVKGVLQDHGAHFNASTWFDRTNYYESLTPTVENLDFALGLEADRMINSLILQSDLESEMTVVRNEFEMGENNPVHVLHDQLMSAAYRWHNYGKTTIGNRSDIERVPALTLKKFYEHYYQPDNAVLLIAGQFNKDEALKLVRKHFAKIPRPARKLLDTYTEEPAQDGPREVILERVGDIASVAVGYHIPSMRHEDHAAIRLFLDVMGDEPGGLLYEKLVKSGKSSELSAFAYSLYDPGLAMVFVRPTEVDRAFGLRDELCNLLEKEGQSAVDEKKLERAKTRFLKSFKLALNNSKDFGLRLSEAIACGDWRLSFWYKESIAAVSLADLKRVAEQYFLKSNRTSGIFIPDENPRRASIPVAEEAHALVAKLRDDGIVKAGEHFDPEPAFIEERIKRFSKSTEKRAAFLLKKTRGQSVRAQFIVRFAHEALLSPALDEIEMLAPLMMRGSKNHDYQALRDKLDGLMSTLEMSSHGGTLSARIKTEGDYLLESINLLGEILAKPALSEDEFKLLRQREIDDLEEILSDPQRVAFNELDRLKNPWPQTSIHYVPSFTERLTAFKNLSVNSVRQAYETLFSSLHVDWAIVGDVSDDHLYEKSAGIFSKEGPAYERIKRPFLKNIPEKRFFDTKDKEMALIAWGFNFPLRDDHRDFPALKIANYMFGENMNSRLMKRIREKEGISYGASSFIESNSFEENSSFTLYAMAAPDRVTAAEKAIHEEWLRFVEDGVSDHELLLAKESMWLSFQNLLANDNVLVSMLAADLEKGRNLLWRQELFDNIKALSRDDVHRSIGSWWGKAEWSKVCAGDKAKIS